MSTTQFERRVRRDQQPADDPLLQAERPERVAHYQALGERITVETNDERIERVARHAFGNRPSRERAGPGITLRLLRHDVPEEDSWTPLQPVMRSQGDYFYVAASRASVVSGNVASGFAFGFVSDREASHEEHLRSTMILSPLLWMATVRSLTAIHCACVSLNGTTIMLRGRPNAGKTTLAYAALSAGFSLLCEDVAFAWRSQGGDVELRGMPWHLYLKADAARFFPELAGLEPLERHNGEAKILVEIGERFPEQVIESVPLGPTVFVEHSPDGRNLLLPLDREEALGLYEATRIAVEERHVDGIDIWGGMFDHGAYRFEVGSDPSAAANVLKALCGG